MKMFALILVTASQKMLSGLSSFLFGSQRKDDGKKKLVPPPSETDDKSEWLLVNSSGMFS